MIANYFPPSNSNIWSFLDQALVSGCNFLCGILLARVLGLEAFGAYVVAQTYLLYANTFQSALVVSPMMTSVPGESRPAERRRLLQGFFGYTLLVLIVTVFVVQIAAWFLGKWSPAIGLEDLTLPSAMAMGCFQVQDWLRRASYSEIENRRVFIGDCFAYGGQFVVLLLLSIMSALSAERALWVMSFSFFISAMLFIFRTRLFPDYSSTFSIIATNWRASRNFLLSWQLQWAASSGVILLGTGMVGQHAAGAIRAIQNLLGPVNVFFQWMDNSVPVRAAVRFRDGGRGALSSYLWRLGSVGFLALGIFAVCLFSINEPLIVLLYGEDYRPFAILVVFQALYYLFGHAYRMASYFKRTLGETKELAVASAWWATVALVSAMLMVDKFADRGIMAALVFGEVAGLIYLLKRGRRIPKNGATHSVLRRGDGSVQLLIPIKSFNLAKAALSMYFPSRWTGVLYRKFLELSLPLRLFLNIAELHHSLDSQFPHVKVLENAFPDLQLQNFGVLISAPGANSKLTLKLMDDRANVHAYARLAYGPQAIAAIRQEASVLELVHRRGDTGLHVPKVLHSLELKEPDAFCLVETAGPEIPAGKRLTTGHFKFLEKLITGEYVALNLVVANARADITANIDHEQVRDICLKACNELDRLPSQRIPICIEHGDFAPWNIRMRADGLLFFIDWESGNSQGLPWMDALHFVFQMETLVNHSSPLRVKRALIEIFVSLDASTYARLLPEQLARKESIFPILYLLRFLCLGAREGLSCNSGIQNIRLTILSMFLNDLHLESR